MYILPHHTGNLQPFLHNGKKGLGTPVVEKFPENFPLHYTGSFTFPVWWKEGFLSPVNGKVPGSLHGGRKSSSVQWTGKVPGFLHGSSLA